MKASLGRRHGCLDNTTQTVPMKASLPKAASTQDKKATTSKSKIIHTSKELS